MTHYLLCSNVLCLLALAISVKSCQNAESKARQMASDRHALLDGITFYRTKDSLSAASVERLTLSKAELERYNAHLDQTARDLGIKVRRLEAASTTSTQTTIEAVAPLRDTVFIEKGAKIQARTFVWADPWVDISGVIREPPNVIRGPQITCTLHARDTIDQIVHRVPRQFLFFKFGTKAIRQEVVSRNPHTQITYTEYLEFR